MSEPKETNADDFYLFNVNSWAHCTISSRIFEHNINHVAIKKVAEPEEHKGICLDLLVAFCIKSI